MRPGIDIDTVGVDTSIPPSQLQPGDMTAFPVAGLNCLFWDQAFIDKEFHPANPSIRDDRGAFWNIASQTWSTPWWVRFRKNRCQPYLVFADTRIGLKDAPRRNTSRHRMQRCRRLEMRVPRVTEAPPRMSLEAVTISRAASSSSNRSAVLRTKGRGRSSETRRGQSSPEEGATAIR